MPKQAYIIFQTKDADYFPFTLKQLAKANSSNSPIYLIGGPTVKKYTFNNIVWIDYTTLETSYLELTNNYFHLSSLGYDFELICIQRWFATLKVMENFQLERAIYLDSDILVYHDLFDLWEEIDSPGLTRLINASPTCFIKSKEVLRQFCEMTLSYYTTDSGKEELHQHFTAWRKKHDLGGISDMTFSEFFGIKYPHLSKDISHIRKQNNIDVRLDYTVDFQTDENGFKKMVLENNIPYGFHNSFGKVSFATIHLQGRSKPQLLKLLPGNPLFNKLAFWAHKFNLKLKNQISKAIKV